MVLPIYVYGQPLLRRISPDISKDHEGLEQFISDMWDTMYKCDGIGLAAPQVGNSIRLFVIDLAALEEDHPELKTFKKVFINAQIIEKTGDEWPYTEGCISIPSIREEVYRPEKIHIKYVDENWVEHDETFDGIAARVIQHEYDHLQGIMFVDHLSTLKRHLLKNKLTAITKGRVDTSFKIKIPK